MSRVGYARVSSAEQNLDRQLITLGVVDKLFTERASGKSANRPELEKCLNYLRAGDELVVSSADRLARNTVDLVQIVQRQVGNGVTVNFINDGLRFEGGTVDEDGHVTLNEHDEFRLTILGAVAKLERSLIRARQREGIEARKAKNGYMRPAALTPQQVEDARKQVAQGVPKTKVAQALGVEVRTIYRALNGEGVYAADAWKQGKMTV